MKRNDKFNEQIKNILIIIDRDFPSETDASIASRVNVQPNTVSKWRKTGNGNSNKAFDLVISLYENNPSFLKSFINDSEVKAFLQEYLANGGTCSHKSQNEWNNFWGKISSKRFDGTAFSNAVEILETEEEHG
jgi:hypothetical protein